MSAFFRKNIHQVFPTKIQEFLNNSRKHMSMDQTHKKHRGSFLEIIFFIIIHILNIVQFIRNVQISTIFVVSFQHEFID